MFDVDDTLARLEEPFSYVFLASMEYTNYSDQFRL